MSKYLRVGIFAGLSIAFTLWIGMRIAGVDRGTSRYELHASFDDATNLQPADPVKLAGVRVGRVTDVALVRGVAHVRFTVNRSVPLPTDTVVAIRSQDLLGRRLLRIEPGSATTILVDGDTVADTVSAVELGALINELGPLLEAVRPEQVNTLVRALNEALAGNQETLAGAAIDLATLLETLASRADTIERLIDDYGVLASEVADRDVQIQRLIDNLVLLTETFAASDEVLGEALDTVPGVTEDLRSLLADQPRELDRVIANLAAIGNDVRAQLDDVDAIAAGLPATLTDLFSVVDDGEFVNINFNCVSNEPPPCSHPDIGDEEPEDEDSLTDVLAELLGVGLP